jgi:hypothetical protein
VKRKNNTEAVLTPDPYLGFLQSMALQGVGLDSTSATVDRTALAEAISANEAGELALDANFGVLLNSAEFLVTVGAFKLTQLHRKDRKSPFLCLNVRFGNVSTQPTRRFSDGRAFRKHRGQANLLAVLEAFCRGHNLPDGYHPGPVYP